MSIPIKVVPNFLPLVECERWIQIINELEQSRPLDFVTYKDNDSYRISFQFGEKDYGDSSPRPDMSILSKNEEIVRQIFLRVIESVQLDLHSGELYTSVFWLAKQYPGSRINLHEDTDGGADSHITISSLIYLNSQDSGGELLFPKFNYSYAPRAGDLIMFDTIAAGVHGVETINKERYSLPIWMTKDKKYELGYTS